MSEMPQPVEKLTAAETAIWLNIDLAGLQALNRAGYIQSDETGDFSLAEVKSFAARNSKESERPRRQQGQPGDFAKLVEALNGEIDDLAHRAQASFLKAVPETRQWGESQRHDFLNQARARFSAMLAVVSQGAQVDASLRDDLELVGVNAAQVGSSLPHLQLVLRISRDLLIQSAMRLANGSGGQWDAALEAFLARLFPAIDNMLDAIALGYWDTLLTEQRDIRLRFSSLIEKLPFPIYEADLDGKLRHVNIAFTKLFRRPSDELVGLPIADVIRPTEGDVSALLNEPEGDVARTSLVVESPIGGLVRVDIDTVVRRVDGEVAGFGGLMRLRRA